MQNWRWKNILSRVILGESWRDAINPDYLCAGIENLFTEPSPYTFSETAMDTNEGERSSNDSISTTTTADDLPGAGRTVDMYICQPAGRWLERLAMQFTISSLHPACIAQYIEAEYTVYGPRFDDTHSLNDAVAYLCDWQWNGPIIVAGMKGLVKQTQSNSIHRSASALAALIRVSMCAGRREIYVNISRIGCLFHLEVLAGSLAHSHPERKYFFLLTKLARETLIAVRHPSVQKSFDPVLGKAVNELRPSHKIALDLRQRLIRILDMNRCSGYEAYDSLNVTIGGACAICAESLSTCIDYSARGEAYMHILESVYFSIVFVLGSAHKLADCSRLTANRHIYIVLRTLTSWIDAITYRVLYDVGYREERFDINLLNVGMSFRSLVSIDDNTARLLLPESFGYANRISLLNECVLPRRLRVITNGNEDNPLVQCLIKLSVRRTQRLLNSFDELKREVLENTLTNSNSPSPLEIKSDPLWFSLHDFGQGWWRTWETTLERARGVQVQRNSLTEEFCEARSVGLGRDPYACMEWQVIEDRRNWAYYQLHRLSRNKWGQYFRSNMDWDWDLGACMKRMFKVEKETCAGRSPAAQIQPTSSRAMMEVDTVRDGTLRILLDEPQGGIPKDVQVECKTKTGETHCILFVPESRSQGRSSSLVSEHSIAQPQEIVATTRAQVTFPESLAPRKGDFNGKREIEEVITSWATSNEPQSTACQELSFVEYKGSHEGEHIVDNGRFNEVRSEGGDVISICSLD